MALKWQFYLPASADPPRNRGFTSHEEEIRERTLQIIGEGQFICQFQMK